MTETRINGKRYNTETAKEVAEWWNERSAEDLDHVYEEVYRKRTGEYFLYAEGGAATGFAEPDPYEDDMTESGELIKPLTKDEAKAYCKDFMNRPYGGRVLDKKLYNNLMA